MAQDSDDNQAPMFERIEEYRAVLENIAQVSARRQYFNSLFVAINTVFLTALGVLLFTSRLDTWWLAAGLGAVAVVVTPLNIMWRTALVRYKRGLTLQYEYVREIEMEFRARRHARSDEPLLGMFLKIDRDRRPHSGNTRIEMRLAAYFIVLYPLIAIVVTALVFLVTHQFVTPFTP